MSIGTIALILLALVIVFWVGPCVVFVFMLFFGHWDYESAMNKSYFQPWQKEMAEAISFLDEKAPLEVFISARDKTPLYARWFDNGSKKTMVMAHGFNASAYSNFCFQGKFFHEKGFNLLMIDHRAHGRSGGKATAFGVLEQYDLIDWVRWVRENTDTEKVVCYGISMGCAAVAYASSKVGRGMVDAMVLDCGFSSPCDQMESVAKKRRIPWKMMLPLVEVLVKLLVKCDLRETVYESLEKTEIPAIFLHGTKDDVVDIAQAEVNYAHCQAEKQFVAVEGAEHTMAFTDGGESVKKTLLEFIDRYTN